MPDPAGTHQDGGVQYGSQKTTMKDVTGTNADYVLKNININYPANKLVRLNEVGVPDGQVFIDQIDNGTATGQFGTSTQKLPKKYEKFNLLPRGGGSPVAWKVESVSDSWIQDGEATFSITFTKSFT
jgi:hypothetical protein